jgi:hypothetical protein
MKPPLEPQELPRPVTPEDHILAAAGALLRARQARFEAELDTHQGALRAKRQRARRAVERERPWHRGRTAIAAGVAGLVCGGLLGLSPWAYERLTGQVVVDLRRAVVSAQPASTGRAAGAIGTAGTASYSVSVGDPPRWAAALASRLIASGVGVTLWAMPGEPIVLGFTLPASTAADVYELLKRAHIPLVRDRPIRLVIDSPFGTDSH